MSVIYWLCVLVIATVFCIFGFLAGFKGFALLAYPVIIALAAMLISNKNNYNDD